MFHIQDAFTDASTSGIYKKPVDPRFMSNKYIHGGCDEKKEESQMHRWSTSLLPNLN